jgi:hypothetical protein
LRTYEWDETCNEAFETLKGILVKVPMLKLPNFDKDFEIHSDTSNFAIRGILVQDGRLMALENKKLNNTEQKWLTHEKEMWVVIHCFKTWDLEIFLHSTKVVIKTSEMAKHIGLVQCGHSTQAWKDNVVPNALTPTNKQKKHRM